jgi:hypothetical protein
MAILVEKTRLFGNAYHAYRQTRNPRNDSRSKTARAVTTEERPSTSINYANLEAAEGKITPEEKQQQFKENLCLYCGRPNHRAKDCRKKLARNGKTGNKNYVRREMKARATTVQEENKDDPSPSYASARCQKTFKLLGAFRCFLVLFSWSESMQDNTRYKVQKIWQAYA